MLFGWFDAREESRFGVALADFFAQRLPAVAVAGRGKSGAQGIDIFQKITTQIQQFKQGGRKLNIYKKAKLANAFKWRLADLGYESDFIDEVTKEVLLRL